MLCNKIDININKAEYIESSDKACSKILSEAKSKDIIIVFGIVEFYLQYSIFTYKYSLNQGISMVKAKKSHLFMVRFPLHYPKSSINLL